MVADITAGDLRAQPFAHIAFGAAGAARELPGGQRTGFRQFLVEPEPVAEAHHHAAISGRQVADGARHERIQFRGVDALVLGL
ncbi:hypothetical protein ABIA20_002755 [Sinorhizobium fredii]